MADLESTILALGPQWYMPGRIGGGALLDRSGHFRNATITGNGDASGPALFAGSTSPSDSIGTSAEFFINNVATSGVPMLANQSSSIGLAFVTANSGTPCLFSDNTCTSAAYGVYLSAGVIHVALGNATNITTWTENHAGPALLNLADGVPHVVVWTVNGATHTHTLYVDGVQQLAFSATWVAALWATNANHYAGDLSLCARTNPLTQGYFGHWFGFSSELTNAQVTSIQAAAGTPASGVLLNPPTLADTQAQVEQLQVDLALANGKLDQILASVHRTY